MFDPSAPHIIILLVVVLLLFGSTRLPGAAQAIGKSMHIFKKSVKGLDDEDGNTSDQAAAQQAAAQHAQAQILAPQAPIAQPGASAQDISQQQLADLQRQVADLQRQNAASGAPANGGAPAPEAQRPQQS